MSAVPGPTRGPLRIVARSGDGGRVLARPNGLAGWALPAIAVDLPFLQWSGADVDRASGVLGVPAVPVRRLRPDAWEVETRGRVSAAGTTWIGLEDVERLGVDAPAVRAALGEQPAEQGHLRPGWMGDLQAWIDERFSRTGPLTLHCHWELSAVVSFPTDDGVVVVKQNGPGFTRERAVLDVLGGIAHVPRVLAADGDLVAMAWAGVEGAERPAALAALGRLHREAEDRVPQLRTAGCPTADDLARAACGEAIAPHLEVVAALGLPTTVVHADAHAGNILIDRNRVTVIDWTDAVVGSPVLDLPMLLLPEPDDLAHAERGTVEGWASGHGGDPAPIIAAFGSVRTVACAVTVALYDLHVDDLPASARPWWADWTQGWRRRLDAALASSASG